MVPEYTFRVEVADIADITPDELTEVQNAVLKSIGDRLGAAVGKDWLEAGGYVKWSKGSATLEPLLGFPELTRVDEIGELARITRR